MESQGFDYGVITEHDLDREGAELLAPHNVVVTGSHPEYTSERMLDSLEAYLRAGGRLMYLGGNGFYWVTSRSTEHPEVLEVRRWAGTRHWDAAPGEYHHSTTGELGGLWRYRGRAPQRLVGVGFTAQGWTAAGSCGLARPYRRQPGSFDPRAAFIFEGIAPDEVIGDFPSLGLGRGAAGDELDRLDHALGTPDHALLLATADGFTRDYQHVVEEVRGMNDGTTNAGNPLVRSDLVYFEYPNGGAVFSVGSISWFGSLSYDAYDNNVSRLTGNVLRRFASDETLPPPGP
jgi:N,N-dimethylformamidase